MRSLLFALAIAAGCNPDTTSSQPQYPQTSQYEYETAPQQTYSQPPQTLPPQQQPQTYGYSYGRQHLGVSLERMTPELRAYFGAPPDRGVLVTRVMPGSAAEQAGLRVGDVIVEAGNHSIQRTDDLRSVITASADNTLDIEAIRHGSQTSLRAQLGHQAPQPDSTL